MLCRLRAALTFTVVLLSISALAQEPSKGPVRLLVGFAPGGSSDLAARIIADKLKDVLGAPVMHVANYQLALSAGSNPPAKTLAELTTWLKANPSKASFGSPAPGSLPHFFGLMVGRSIGVDIQHIAY
ncbi:MAG: tripartite tricarboxylate transporter substrate-binding protein, partial [Betaproteobacteria bacterium]